MSRYDADDVYCIPGTAVLKNKAGITDQNQLDEFEGDFTAIRLLELTQNPVEGSFDLAHYLSEINAIHPFREGNGRVQRLFISQLAEHAGYFLDYSALDQADLYPVMQESFLGNVKPLAGLILKIID